MRQVTTHQRTLVCVGRWEAWGALQVGDIGLLEDCSDRHAALCSEVIVIEAAVTSAGHAQVDDRTSQGDAPH